MIARSHFTHCLWVISCAALATACGGGATPTSPSGTSTTATSTATRGTAQDPANDAARLSGVAVSPELLSVDIERDVTTTRVAVVFAAGTFDARTTWVQAQLDTDERASSGLPGTGPGPEDDGLLGVDFVLDYAASGYNPRRADLFACATNAPSSCRSVATPSVALTSERIEWRFPTTALQDADGLMRMKVIAFVGDFPGETSDDADVVPDHGLPAMLVR